MSPESVREPVAGDEGVDVLQAIGKAAWVGGASFALLLGSSVADASAAQRVALSPVGSAHAIRMVAGPHHSAQAGEASPRRLELRGGPQARFDTMRTLQSAARIEATPASPSASSTGPQVFEDKLGASSFNQLFCCTPPDSTGAIGPSNYVEAVNQLITVYGRDLTQLAQAGTPAFVGASFGTVSDPQLEWDNQWARWIYAATLVALHNNFLLFGWSKTADPSDLAGGWCRFGVGIGTNFDDYPKLGHSDGVLVIGANVFDDTTGKFLPVTADIWAIPKPANPGSCQGPTAFHFATGAMPLRNADGSLADTPVPANAADASPLAYLVAAHSAVGAGPQSRVMLWHVAAGPILVPDGDLAVGTYNVPPPAAQQGSSLSIDTLDGRLTQAVSHFDPDAASNAIWTQHTVAGPTGSVVVWYEILPGSMTVRQSGVVAFAGYSVYNAAISPSSAGNDAAIEFNVSGASVLPLIAAQSRRSVTALGAMDPGVSFLAISSQADNDISCTPTCRWGDYSGATPDPVFPHAVWASSQVYATQVPPLPDWVTANFVLFMAP